MSYIGNNLQVAYPSYANIDDISGSFDGVTTSFPLTVGGVAPVPAPLSSNQCLISVGGVVQRPDDSGSEGFLLSGGNIVFSAAPTGGDDFFGVILAGADYVNVGVNFPSGTASTPSITFDTDLDTGLFNSGANELAISTAGTSRLVVDSGGNVNIDAGGAYYDATNNRLGIGTSSPSVELEVAGSEAEIRLRDTRVDDAGYWSFKSELSVGTRKLFIQDDGADRITLDASGNVGIGTTSPGTLLELKQLTGDTELRLYSNTGYVSRIGAVGSDNLAFSTGFTERARIDGNGRLLVGTSTARTNVAGSSGAAGYKVQIESSGTDGIACLSLINNYSAGYPGSLAIGKTNGSSVGSNTIVSNGNDIGIISFVGADGTNLLRAAAITAFVDNPPGANDMPGRLVFSTTADGANSPTERMRISHTGKLTVPGVYNGTTTGGSAVYVEADGDLLRFTSSRKYKTDIETIEDERADAILECRPVWYRSLSQNDIKTEGATKSDWGWYGFIAEEVAEIDPRLVSWATKDAVPQEDGSLKSIERDPVDYEAEGVRYDNFVPLLLNLIKRQKEQIEAMEARLTALETA